uniref:[histone H3]-lysine(4) N-trimethyltransferase n=1 Tax=Emiliania huxleyi TaxID=2903 RepID=A0A6V2U8N9_EMIHU
MPAGEHTLGRRETHRGRHGAHGEGGGRGREGREKRGRERRGPCFRQDFVVEYIGEYVRSSLAEQREQKYRKLGYGDDYIFRVDAEQLVDATCKGGVARFANHCCEPNCYTRIITAGGKPRIVLYSKRPIEPGEEITYNYNFDIDEDPTLRIPCRCGSKGCKGFLN